MKGMRTLLLIVVVLGGVYVALNQTGEVSEAEKSGRVSENRPQEAASDADIADAFANQQSDVLVEGRGEVVRVLSDDLEGDRHQRFILRLDSGQTLLVAHNIDLAPRLPQLREGEIVEFFGEYEWNERGGVIHWTHHDPRGRHPSGWLKYRGVTYQ